ncbi:MAG: hypothetical protein R3E31_26655 [Chloroflexota bacterium]
MNLRAQFTDPKKLLIWILLVSVLLRVGSALYLGNEVVELPGTADQESYHNLALRVLDGHGFSFGEQWWPATRANEPTAHWSFLYTLYLVAVYALTGSSPLAARLLQAVLVGILMPWLVYRVAQRLFSPRAGAEMTQPEWQRGQWIGLIAAGITAVYIYFFYYAGALMTESFYITSILWSFDVALGIKMAERPLLRQWLHLGLALSVVVLLRQLFLLFIPFLLLWLWWSTRPKLWQVALPFMIVILMMLPWIIRNYIVFDQFVMLNTNSGYAFYWGNHPIYGTKFIPILPPEMGSYYSLIPQDLLYLNEAKLDSALLKLALADIMADPGRYLLLSLSRIPPYFEFWPTAKSSVVSNVSRVASFGLFLPFMLYGLIRTFRYRYGGWRQWLASPFTLIYLFILVYTGIHLLTWTLVRYRLPIDAFLTIFAALALWQLAQWVQRRRS